MKTKPGTYKELVVDFSAVGIDEFSLVGGKNASIGELIRALQPQGIHVPNGFATTSVAYWNFVDSKLLKVALQKLLRSLDRKVFVNLALISFEKIIWKCYKQRRKNMLCFHHSPGTESGSNCRN